MAGKGRRRAPLTYVVTTRDSGLPSPESRARVELGHRIWAEAVMDLLIRRESERIKQQTADNSQLFTEDDYDLEDPC